MRIRTYYNHKLGQRGLRSLLFSLYKNCVTESKESKVNTHNKQNTKIMGLGIAETKKTYLSITHGKVVRTAKGGSTEEYSYIEGTLEDIYKKERTFNGQRAVFWYIDIRDGADLYSLSLPYVSGVFKSIVLSLASDKELNACSPVRIEPYLGKNGLSKIVVYSEGVKLDWVTKTLPPLKEVSVGGKIYKDDTERMGFIESLAKEVRERVAIAKK